MSEENKIYPGYSDFLNRHLFLMNLINGILDVFNFCYNIIFRFWFLFLLLLLVTVTVSDPSLMGIIAAVIIFLILGFMWRFVDWVLSMLYGLLRFIIFDFANACLKSNIFWFIPFIINTALTIILMFSVSLMITLSLSAIWEAIQKFNPGLEKFNEIENIAAWIIFCGIPAVIIIISGFKDRCPLCHKWWAKITFSREELERNQRQRTVRRKEIIYNNFGAAAGSINRMEQIRSDNVVERCDCGCAYCGHQWSVVSNRIDE